MERKTIKKRWRRAAMMIVLVAMALNTLTVRADNGDAATGVNYVDAKGVLRNTQTDGIDGNDTPAVLASADDEKTITGGWYVVKDEVTLSSNLDFEGDVHLILADGATMTLPSLSLEEATGIEHIAVNGKGQLTIYGQTAGTGTFNSQRPLIGMEGWDLTFNGGQVVIESLVVSIYILSGNVTVNGGTLSAKIIRPAPALTRTDDSYSVGMFLDFDSRLIVNGGTATFEGIEFGIIMMDGGDSRRYDAARRLTAERAKKTEDLRSITVNGGSLTATGSVGIMAQFGLTFNGGQLEAVGQTIGYHGSDIKLHWSSAADRFYINSLQVFDDYGVSTIADGQSFVSDDETPVVISSGDTDIPDKLAGKHMRPYGMTMQAKMATDVDGYWTTLYHGGATLDIETPDAKAYIATCDNNGETETLTLHGIGTTIPQATGVIVVAENNEEIRLKVNYESAETAPSANSLHGVDNQTPTAEAMAGENDGCKPFVLSYKEATGLGFYEYTGDNLPAHKAFLPVSASSNTTRLLWQIDSQETNGMSGVADRKNNSEVWFTLDGRRLAGKPTRHGLYVRNGRKEIVL